MKMHIVCLLFVHCYARNIVKKVNLNLENFGCNGEFRNSVTWVILGMTNRQTLARKTLEFSFFTSKALFRLESV